MSPKSHSHSPSSVDKKSAGHHHHEGSSGDLIVPWFPSPMQGWDEGVGCFSPRHEASTIELFFDLWFVANLATFTQYHAITNHYSFWSYIAFFIVLWTSWFHVVCFDARFTSDSVWERACKTVHFCAFAGFALAGYKFMPVPEDAQDATPHWIYYVLCTALLITRTWLALQYLVTAIMCSSTKHRPHRLTLPLVLNAVLFLCCAAVFGGLIAGFSNVQGNLVGLLLGVYVVLTVEIVGTLIISMTWRKLSFKATHIGERLGLLGLIIIGEGVIGTTKTVTRTMGKKGPALEASAQIFCIVLILVFMWILYFDKVPKYRFGTVKQQVWMALHLPFHLAILGVVEGSQQLAQARYIYFNMETLHHKVADACSIGHLDGQVLATSLTKIVEYFKVNESARGTLALDYVWPQVYLLGNETGICSLSNTTDLSNQLFTTDPTARLFGIPISFAQFFVRTIGAMFQALNIDIPNESAEDSGLTIALRSWTVVYTYFWSAIILLELCYLVTSLLAENADGGGYWRAPLRYKSGLVFSRGSMIAIAILLLILGRARPRFIQEYIASGWILPTIVLKLWFICLSDRVITLLQQRKERKQSYKCVATALTEDQPGRQLGQQDFQMRRRQTNGYGYPLH
ncbi:hypothetical protein ACN47E_003487 [Coniothyrium glycines]